MDGLGRDTVRDRDWDLFTRTRYSGECRGVIDSFQTSPILADRLSCYNQYRTDTTFRGRAVVETEQVSKLLKVRFSIDSSSRFAMLKNVRGCATSSGTVVSTSAMLLPTGRSLGGRRAPACSATPTAGTWTQTWSTGGTGRCLNIKGKVVTAEVETPLVSEKIRLSG